MWSRKCLPIWSTWVHPQFFYRGSFYLIFSFICMFCRSLFVLLYFFFGHCIGSSSSIYDFCLSLWYLQTFLSEQVFQMKQLNDKCINSKNKIKSFWNFIKGYNYVNSPSQVFNPENHSDMLVDTGDINKALQSHFSSIGPRQSRYRK